MKGAAHHHISRRKRTADKNLAPYPHPSPRHRMLDTTTLIAGIVGPLMVIPQIVRILTEQDASGVSAVSWFFFTLIDIPFIVYSVVHNERLLFVSYALFFVANGIVTVLAIIW